MNQEQTCCRHVGHGTLLVVLADPGRAAAALQALAGQASIRPYAEVLVQLSWGESEPTRSLTLPPRRPARPARQCLQASCSPQGSAQSPLQPWQTG